MRSVQGEPWPSGLPVAGERQYLLDLGLSLREVLPVGGEESIKRYLTKTDGAQVGGQEWSAARATTTNYPAWLARAERQSRRSTRAGDARAARVACAATASHATSNATPKLSTNGIAETPARIANRLR